MTWSSENIPAVGNDPRLWTIAEAAMALGLTPRETVVLRQKLAYTHVFPVGRRRSMIGSVDGSHSSGNRGRYAKVYRASELIEVIELLCIIVDHRPKRHAGTRIIS